MENNKSGPVVDDIEDSHVEDDNNEHGVFNFASFRRRFKSKVDNSTAVPEDEITETDGLEEASTPQDPVDDANPASASDSTGTAGTDNSPVSVQGIEPITMLKSQPLLRAPIGLAVGIGGIDSESALDVDCELMQREFGVGAEIEFEIVIKRSSCRRSNQVFATGGKETVASLTSGSSDDRWVIWKTAKEIFNLHASVVSCLGFVV